MHIYPKKTLGQYFLRSERIVRKVVETAGLDEDEVVLEIGPGMGILTKVLLEKVYKVVAVEKDGRMIVELQKIFAEEIQNGKLTLVHHDILTFSPKEHGLTANNYKVVANIPYYITGKLLRRFLSQEIYPSSMVLMVQKEIAERIVAKNGKESVLSISVKAYGEPKYIGTVKASLFSPKPKVDSAIITIKDISKSFFANFSEEHFFKLVRRGFAHKRKLFINNLVTEKCRKKALDQAFKKSAIDTSSRAENVSLDGWRQLVLSLKGC